MLIVAMTTELTHQGFPVSDTVVTSTNQSCVTAAPPSPLENVKHAGSWEVSPLSPQPGNTTPDLRPVQSLNTSDIKEKAKGGSPCVCRGLSC